MGGGEELAYLQVVETLPERNPCDTSRDVGWDPFVGQEGWLSHSHPEGVGRLGSRHEVAEEGRGVEHLAKPPDGEPRPFIATALVHCYTATITLLHYNSTSLLYFTTTLLYYY